MADEQQQDTQGVLRRTSEYSFVSEQQGGSISIDFQSPSFVNNIDVFVNDPVYVLDFSYIKGRPIEPLPEGKDYDMDFPPGLIRPAARVALRNGDIPDIIGILLSYYVHNEQAFGRGFDERLKKFLKDLVASDFKAKALEDILQEKGL